jgi:hypothetical protein
MAHEGHPNRELTSNQIFLAVNWYLLVNRALMEEQNREPQKVTGFEKEAGTVSGKIYLKAGELPKGFTDVTLLRAFSDYSVALGIHREGKYMRLGTGVLVRKGKRMGILTAYHCLHSSTPEVRLGDENGDALCLILNRARTIIVKPVEVCEHRLAKPKMEEFGPDLTFIEIVSIERLGTFNAYGTFWSLDRDSSKVLGKFGNAGTPIAAVGFPEVYYSQVTDGQRVKHQVRHMTYYNAIKDENIFTRDGWDYLDSTIWYPGSEGLPSSFEGVSGGPVWGMELCLNKADGSVTIADSALIGITFYEIYRRGDEGRLRAHFIRSIYDLAWQGIGE